MKRICKRCGKAEISKTGYFSSPYCFPCNKYFYNKRRRKMLRKEHKCVSCGIKKIKPVYPWRCEDCNKKNRKTYIGESPDTNKKDERGKNK